VGNIVVQCSRQHGVQLLSFANDVVEDLRDRVSPSCACRMQRASPSDFYCPASEHYRNSHAATAYYGKSPARLSAHADPGTCGHSHLVPHAREEVELLIDSVHLLFDREVRFYAVQLFLDLGDLGLDLVDGSCRNGARALVLAASRKCVNSHPHRDRADSTSLCTPRQSTRPPEKGVRSLPSNSDVWNIPRKPQPHQSSLHISQEHRSRWQELQCHPAQRQLLHLAKLCSGISDQYGVRTARAYITGACALWGSSALSSPSSSGRRLAVTARS
jgi:hypothetical protein